MQPTPDARDYRITDILGNGEAVLDAEDTQPAHHRRFVPAGDLPHGAAVGATLRRYETGAIELVCAVPATAAAIVLADAPHPTRDPAVALSPTLGRIVHAAISTVAQEFDITTRVAAHIVTIWIKVEYLL